MRTMNPNRPKPQELTPIQKARCDAAGLSGSYAAQVPYCDDPEAIQRANALVQEAVQIIREAGVREHVPQAPSQNAISDAREETREATSATCE